MPRIKLTVPHALGKEEAKLRITNLIAERHGKFGDMVNDLEQTWDGYVATFRFRVMGFAIAGRIFVEPSSVLVEMEVPWAALPLKGRVEKEILSQATNLLA